MKCVVAIALFAALVVSAPAKDAEPAIPPKTLKVGLLVSTTGPLADFGLQVKNGVDLAVKEINASGGVDGEEIQIVYRDVASKPEEARAGAKFLVGKEEVCSCIGCVASGNTIAAAPIFQDAGVALVTPSGTNPTITEHGDKIFRACYMDDYQAKGLALYAWSDMTAKTAAILQLKHDDYSKILAETFKAEFEALGGTVAAVEIIDGSEKDYEAQLKTIRNSGPDLLFLPLYYEHASSIASQTVDLGLKAKLLGADGWDTQNLPALDVKALEGSVFANHYCAAADETSMAFAKAYSTEHGVEPSSLAALGYDTVFMLAKAMKGAGGDPAKIVSGLAALEGFNGVTGSGVRINKKRNAEKPLIMVKIADGKLTFVREVKYDEVQKPKDK
jgi:branched-chain amino acid transport system substrate-binding protein